MRARRVSAFALLTEAERIYLETGVARGLGLKPFIDDDWPLGPWRAVAEEMVAAWIARHPGTRPYAWWLLDKPAADRRRLGGTGDVWHEGKPNAFGIETDWVWQWMVEYYNGRSFQPKDRGPWNTDCVEGAFTKVAVDPHDPPTFESQATYLERHGLLTDDERARLTAAAFEPEVLEITTEAR